MSSLSLDWVPVHSKNITSFNLLPKLFIFANLGKTMNIEIGSWILLCEFPWKCDLYEQLPFIYRFKLYSVFIKWGNEADLCRQWFVVYRKHLRQELKTRPEHLSLYHVFIGFVLLNLYRSRTQLTYTSGTQLTYRSRTKLTYRSRTQLTYRSRWETEKDNKKRDKQWSRKTIQKIKDWATQTQ
jgi:hypothetical protein